MDRPKRGREDGKGSCGKRLRPNWNGMILAIKKQRLIADKSENYVIIFELSDIFCK